MVLRFPASEAHYNTTPTSSARRRHSCPEDIVSITPPASRRWPPLGRHYQPRSPTRHVLAHRCRKLVVLDRDLAVHRLRRLRMFLRARARFRGPHSTAVNSLEELVPPYATALETATTRSPFTVGLDTENRVPYRAAKCLNGSPANARYRHGECTPIMIKMDVEGYEGCTPAALARDRMQVVDLETITL